MIKPEDRSIHPSLRASFVELPDVNLHVVQAGPEDGPLLILLHGFPEFWYGWRHQIGRFADNGYQVWAPDQRGYNLSDKPSGVSAYHIDTLARDVIGLIAAAGHKQAYVVGHDWGAAVAWHIATVHPEKVKKLGILNVPHPTVMIQSLRKSLSQLRKSWYIFFFQIPWLPEWGLGRKDAQGAIELLRRSGKQDTFTDNEIDRYREAWTQPGVWTAMINWYRSSIRSGFGNTFRSLSELPRISVPTLMLWGKQDVALGHEMAQPSIDLCEKGKLIFLEEATHWVQHDEYEEVNRALLEFIRNAW
jgi:pimeloyl-ACP methyl ester carboxylesterase